MESYINQYGVKTSPKLDKIMAAARDFIYGGRGYNPRKFETKKYYRLVIQFDKEADAIGGVDYHLCDALA